MGVTELQKNISALSPSQRRVVAKVIARIQAPKSEARARQLGTTLRAMEEGSRVTLAEIKRARRNVTR